MCIGIIGNMNEGGIFFKIGLKVSPRVTVTGKTGVAVSGWEDGFATVSRKHKYVLLDDMTVISSYKRFHKAFYDCLITDIYTRPFTVLIVQPTDDVGGLADKYDAISLVEVERLKY